MVDRKNVYDLPRSVRDKVYTVRLATGKGGEDLILDENYDGSVNQGDIYTYHTTFQKIAAINYAILVNTIKRYKQLKGKHQKDEYYLADLLK